MRFLRPALGLAVALGGAGCGDDSTKALGAGDKVVVDVDATSQPPQQPSDDAAGSIFARLDGAYGVVPDGYAPLQACSRCACGPGTFCFGGGGGYASFTGACAPGSAAPGVGCVAIPPACLHEPSCPCILGAFTGVSCYTVCAEETGFAVYCPSP